MRRRLRRLARWGLVTLAGAACPIMAADAPRRPVPDAAAVAGAEKLVKELYAREFADRTPAGRTALAEKLRKTAAETADDPVARFVLLRESANVWASTGDVTTAFKVIDELSAAYEYDARPAKADALHKAAPAVTAPALAMLMAESAVALCADAMAADEYELAARAIAIAEPAARRSGDSAILADVRARSDELRRIQVQLPKVRQARQTLQERPDDPAANLVVGEFHCFVKGDWDAGLSALAKGTDPALKALATLDATTAAEPAAQVETADAWWNAAERQAPVTRRRMRERAAWWYDRALPQLTGLKKAAAERRIAEAEGQGQGARPVAPTYLASLTPADFKGQHKFGQVGGGTRQAVVVGGRPSPNGLITHPKASGEARTTYRLDGKYRVLEGAVSINDSAGNRGRSTTPLTFKVIADGKTLWASKPLQHSTEVERFRVNVARARELVLVVECPRTDESAHAAWIEPLLK